MTTLPPGPPVPPVAMNVLWAASPMRVVDYAVRRYGARFRLSFQGLGHVVFLGAPADVKRVFTADPEWTRAGEGNAFLRPLLGGKSLLLLDGAEHLRQRKLLLPPFHGERMQSYFDVMRDETSREIEAWPYDRAFATLPSMRDITLRVIFRAVFGLGEPTQRTELHEQLARFVELGNSWPLMIPSLQVDLGPRSPWGRVRRTRAQTDDALYREIHARRADPRVADRSDVLSMLIQARDGDGQPMTDKELRDQLVTLLVAGHETTASSLAWALDRLLKTPAALDRARDEVRRVVPDGRLRAEHLPQLPYLDAVLRETHRIRPVVPNVARRLRAPLDLGDVTLPAGIFVAPCMLAVHRDSSLFPDPEAFRPERWNDARVDPYEWFPFGGGTRRCIGMAFAMYEMKIVLATLLANVTLRPASDRFENVRRRGVTIVPHRGARVVRVRA